MRSDEVSERMAVHFCLGVARAEFGIETPASAYNGFPSCRFIFLLAERGSEDTVLPTGSFYNLLFRKTCKTKYMDPLLIIGGR